MEVPTLITTYKKQITSKKHTCIIKSDETFEYFRMGI